MKQIGFFHFVDNFNSPIAALSVAIDQWRKKYPDQDIRDSLIVLPEAFNGRDYNTPDSEFPADEILQELRSQFAAPLGLTFIAGVLAGRRNSAYWVDANGPCLMCHKTGDDLTRNYDYATYHLDPRNPLAIGADRIGALICMDATDPVERVRLRRQSFLARLKGQGGKSILCIPGRFRQTHPRLHLDSLSGCWCVVATDKADNGSFVANPSGEIIGPTIKSKNEVKLCQLL